MSPTPLRSVLFHVLLAALAPATLHGAILFQVEKPTIHSEQTTRLNANHDDHHRANWRWTVLEHDGGFIHAGPGGTATYHAPRTLVPRRIHVQVFDERDPMRVEIRQILVMPGVEADLMAWVWDRDWMTPRMSILAGDPDPAPEMPLADFYSISSMALVQDPAMPADINGHLVVGDASGLLLVSEDGRVRPKFGIRLRPAPGHQHPGPYPLEDRHFYCQGVAARPLESRPGNPFHLVWAEMRTDLTGNLDDWHSCIMELRPDGTPRLVAGGPPGYKDGAGPEARFGRIHGLTMDPEGNLTVLDEGSHVIRHISPSGQVSTLAGNRKRSIFPTPQVDGRGPAATFFNLAGIARDPASGDHYVSDGNTIRRVTPAGDVITILGGAKNESGFEPPSTDPTAPVPLGYPCLHRPSGLLVQGRNLFICDNGNQALRVFDLDCRTLTTLCGGPGGGHVLRGGPLPYYSPGRPAGSVAQVPSLRCLAFSASGTLLCGDECAIGEFEAMPHFQSPARLVPGFTPKPGSHPHAPEESSSSTSSSSSSSSSSSTTLPPGESKEGKR